MKLKRHYFKPYNYTIGPYHIKIVNVTNKQILTVNSKYIWEIKTGKIDGLSFRTKETKRLNLKDFLKHKKPIIILREKPYKIYQYVNESEIIDISNSELFIFTGLGIDYWAKNIGSIPENKRMNLLKFIKIKNQDPHFWLDPDNLAVVAKNVATRLSKIDSQNKNYYIHNLEKYLFELNKMHENFKKTLSNCKLDTIVVTHDGFKYLADKYHFKTVAILGLSPDEKPSAKVISDIIDLVKSKHISTVFFEELLPTITIETISNECNVSISELSPLGNIPQEKTEFDYFQLMYHNLKQLKGALHCE